MKKSELRARCGRSLQCEKLPENAIVIETEVAITEAFEGRAVGTDDVGVERLGGRDQPGIVFAEASRRAPLEQGTPTSMGEMKSLDGEPLKRMERGRFVGSALQHLFDADYRHNEPTAAEAR